MPNDDGVGEMFDALLNRQVDESLKTATDRLGGAIQERVEATVTGAVERRVEAISSAKLDSFISQPEPVRVSLDPLIRTKVMLPLQDFVAALGKEGSELQKLLDHPPVLTGAATQGADGRLVPIVLVVLHDDEGATRPGIELVLRDAAGQLVDRCRMDRNGVVLLRFPLRATGQEAKGKVELGDGSEQHDVTVPADSQFSLLEMSLTSLPDPATVVDLTTGTTTTVIPVDDPFERLPADFTPELCDALTQLTGPVPDPILGRLADPSDFQARRTPLIKRFTVPRIGAVPQNGTPRRYLVRVRQEWTFLGYTLGELAAVDALDPGSVIQEATGAVRRAVDTATRAADQFTSLARESLQSSLSQLSSIDTLINVATSTHARAKAGVEIGGSLPGAVIGGIVAGPIGALVGGTFGGSGVGTDTGTSVLTSSTTTTKTNTSLHVNSLLNSAKSLVNQSIRTATSALRDVTSTVSTEIGRVSPLLSRVTNLLRWVLYENYAVSTHVEDVVEVRSVQITDPFTPDEPLFSDEDIVEYRRYFQPTLLEPLLAPQFEVLRQAVAERIAGGSPISTIHVAVHFSASVLSGNLLVTIGDTRVNLPLRPGATEARAVLRIPPIMPNQLQEMELQLTAQLPDLGPFLDAILGAANGLAALPGEVRVNTINIWYETSPASAPDQREWFGDTVKVTAGSPSVTRTVDLHPSVRLTDTTRNPLFRHVNYHNPSYYFGVLAQAALAVPSVRDDAPQLANFRADNALWRLPILGFEGNRVLIMSDVADDDEDAQSLIDDAGAATIVQLAAPGAYAEALQGLLSLTDAAGMIHPALLPTPSATVPSVAVLNETLAALGNGSTGTGSSSGSTTPGVPVPHP